MYIEASISLTDDHVAKHGNRSNSGKCGSADFVEALGTIIRPNRCRNNDIS